MVFKGFYTSNNAPCSSFEKKGRTRKEQKDPASDQNAEEEFLECDYDVNPTELFLCLQRKEWSGALSQCLRSPMASKTWIVRKEVDKINIRWRILPVHAAFIFKAPEELIQTLLAANPKSASAKDDQGQLPIHCAIYHEYSKDVVKLLLTAFPLAITEKDHKGRTPLDLAKVSRSKDRERYIRLLASSGMAQPTIEKTPSGSLECDFEICPTNLFMTLQRKQWTAAVAACQKYTSEPQTWVYRRTPDQCLSWRLLPIHAAIIYEAPEIVIKSLMEAYPMGARKRNDRGMLPIHLAFRHGCPKPITERLLSAYPESVNESDYKGRKPIDLAQASSSPNREGFVQALRRGSKYYASAIAATERATITNNQKTEFDSELRRVETKHAKQKESLSASNAELVQKIIALKEDWGKKKEATQVLVGVLNSLEMQLEEMNAKEQSLADLVVNLDKDLREAQNEKEGMEKKLRSEIDSLQEEINELRDRQLYAKDAGKLIVQNLQSQIDKVFEERKQSKERDSEAKDELSKIEVKQDEVTSARVEHLVSKNEDARHTPPTTVHCIADNNEDDAIDGKPVGGGKKKDEPKEQQNRDKNENNTGDRGDHEVEQWNFNDENPWNVNKDEKDSQPSLEDDIEEDNVEDDAFEEKIEENPWNVLDKKEKPSDPIVQAGDQVDHEAEVSATAASTQNATEPQDQDNTNNEGTTADNIDDREGGEEEDQREDDCLASTFSDCQYSGLEISLDSNEQHPVVYVQFTLMNQGSDVAMETVHCYVISSSLPCAESDSRDSQTVSVPSGESMMVQFRLTADDFLLPQREDDAGASIGFEICIGPSNEDIKLRKHMHLQRSAFTPKGVSPDDAGLLERAVGSVVSASYTVMAPALIGVLSLVATKNGQQRAQQSNPTNDETINEKRES